MPWLWATRDLEQPRHKYVCPSCMLQLPCPAGLVAAVPNADLDELKELLRDAIEPGTSLVYEVQYVVASGLAPVLQSGWDEHPNAHQDRKLQATDGLHT